MIQQIAYFSILLFIWYIFSFLSPSDATSFGLFPGTPFMSSKKKWNNYQVGFSCKRNFMLYIAIGTNYI